MVKKINKSKKNSRWIMLSFLGLLALIIVFSLIYFNTQDISDIKSEDNIGKEVKVRGEVTNTIKIGQLSGFILKDDTSSIAVSSSNLPNEGDIRTVRGVLMKDSLFGYYIKTN